MFDFAHKEISTQICYIFNTLLRKGSIEAGAHFLEIDESRIKSNLKNLETNLGTPLLLRNQNKLVLTEEGRKFADFSRSVVDGLVHLESNKKQFHKRQQKELIIATYYGFSETILPEIVAQFNTLHPDVHLRILSGIEYIDFSQYDLDVAIAAPIYSRSDLILNHLKSIPYSLYTSPIYIEKYGLPQNYAEFRHHKLLIFKGIHCTPREIFEVATPFLESTNFKLLYELTKKGVGIAVLPKNQVTKEDLETNMITAVIDKLICYKLSFSFMTRKHSNNRSLTRDLFEITNNTLKKYNLE